MPFYSIDIQNRVVNTKTKECALHACKVSKNDSLQKCEFCEKHFCEFHLRSKPVGLAPFDRVGPIAEEFGNEWRAKDGHPCYEFTPLWLDDMKRKHNIGMPIKPYGKPLETIDTRDEIPTLPPEPISKTPISISHDSLIILAIIITLILIIFLLVKVQ